VSVEEAPPIYLVSSYLSWARTLRSGLEATNCRLERLEPELEVDNPRDNCVTTKVSNQMVVVTEHTTNQLFLYFGHFCDLKCHQVPYFCVSVPFATCILNQYLLRLFLHNLKIWLITTQDLSNLFYLHIVEEIFIGILIGNCDDDSITVCRMHFTFAQRSSCEFSWAQNPKILSNCLF